MKFKLKRFYWSLFGTPDCPPLDFEITHKSHHPSPRYVKFAALYLAGLDIETIAKYHNVTRERVRQCIWKAYRDYEL